MAPARIVAVLCFAVCAAWYVRSTIWLEVPGLIDDNSDFRHYQHAAQAIVSGRSPYILESNFPYPPLIAFLTTPLARFDYVTGRRIWFVISQVFFIAAAVLLWRRFGRDWPAACWIAFVWAAGGSAAEALGLGQVGPLLTFLLVVVYTETGWLQGIAAGLCFALKFFPGIVCLGLALRRERNALKGAVTAIVAFLAVPWLVIIQWLPGPKRPPPMEIWAGTPATLSWALPSVILRILDPPHPGGPIPRSWVDSVNLTLIHTPVAHQLVSSAVGLGVFVAGCVLLIRAVGFRTADAQSPWITGAFIALMLAVVPLGWTHYQVMQYPGVALLLLAAWRSRRWMRLALTLVLAALLYPLPVAVLTAYYNRYGAWTAASPATLYIWTSITPLASLALFAIFVDQARVYSARNELAGSTRIARLAGE